MTHLLVDKHNGLIDYCFISSEQYFSYIPIFMMRISLYLPQILLECMVAVTVTLKWVSLQIYHHMLLRWGCTQQRRNRVLYLHVLYPGDLKCGFPVRVLLIKFVQTLPSRTLVYMYMYFDLSILTSKNSYLPKCQYKHQPYVLVINLTYL